MPRRPAPGRAQAAVPLQPRQEGMGDEGVAAVVQGVPGLRRDLVEPVVEAEGPASHSLSRNFSASSAAMQPKPAEVMAWRYTWSATSPAANTPGTEVAVALPSRPDLIVR